MTSTVSCTDSDKEWFNEFKRDDENQAEAFSRLVENAKAYNGELIDPEELAGELEKTLIPMVEVAAFRGTKECVEGEE